MLLLRKLSPTVEQSVRKFRNLPLETGKVADMSELQTHHYTTPGQWCFNVKQSMFYIAVTVAYV